MNAKGTKIIVFADLDGSLLNDRYEYEEIEPILRELLSFNVSIIFNSSKTKSEINYYRTKWNISDPFIAENGSIIVIPKNYFKISCRFSKRALDYNIIELGTVYRIIREKLSAVEDQVRAHVVGFGDMTVEEIAKDSGLPLDLAQLAKKREYSEPFKVLNGNEKQVLQAITKVGLCYTEGRKYFHALGNCDKGKAASILKDLYIQEFTSILTVGIGDSADDLIMLKTVDKPFYVNNEAEKKASWKEILLLAKTFRDG